MKSLSLSRQINYTLVDTINMTVRIPDINVGAINMEGIDAEDMNAKLVDAELKIWKKVEDIAYSIGKHPDEVYADLMIQFSEFIEKKYPTIKYPTEKSAEEQIKKKRSRQAKKTTHNG